ncbi:DDE-type integrase/transposase/recombinase [Rhodococcus jostii]|uniref:DDE-type integrase/transposase/recombinase n=1 Tax=Rhodococcus jostii TaxID=132919 RepID=UPI003632A3D4
MEAAAQRLLIADDAAAAKWGIDLPINDPPRERQVLDAVTAMAAEQHRDRGVVRDDPEWCTRFGSEYARRRAPRPGDKWQVGEVFLTIGGVRKCLWRAGGRASRHGNVPDILIQSKRNGGAATRFFRKIVKRQVRTPRVLVSACASGARPVTRHNPNTVTAARPTDEHCAAVPAPGDRSLSPRHQTVPLVNTPPRPWTCHRPCRHVFLRSSSSHHAHVVEITREPAV